MMTPVEMYLDMHERCKNQKHMLYGAYGGKGSIVGEEWENIDCFIQWAESMWPEDGVPELVIKRGYKVFSPDNCLLVVRGRPVDLPEEETAAIQKRLDAEFEEQYLTMKEYKDRLAICDACEFLKGSRCTKFCSCGGDLHASRRRDVKCPADKW